MLRSSLYIKGTRELVDGPTAGEFEVDADSELIQNRFKTYSWPDMAATFPFFDCLAGAGATAESGPF